MRKDFHSWELELWPLRHSTSAKHQQGQPVMQGADEGRSRKKVSWARCECRLYLSFEVRDEVAASSRAELEEVVMSRER